MNKKIYATVCMLGLIGGTNAFAANEETCYFSNLSNYWDTVYVTPHYASNGGIVFINGNVNVSGLPYGMMNEGDIYKICCYNGRIYYITGTEGSDVQEPVKIYSCDMNGENNILLADNAMAYSTAYIVDNVLYYQEYETVTNEGVQGYAGGISKINLYDLSWEKIVTGHADFTYCDGEYVYYRIYGVGNYAIDVNGNNVYDINPYSDEYDQDLIIKGNRVYYIDNRRLYERIRNGGDMRFICNVPQSTYINNVSSNYIFYSTVKSVSWRDNMVAVTNRIKR